MTVDNPKPGNDEFEERAAHREYDGGYPRAEAERLAHEELLRTRRARVGGLDKGNDAG